MKVLALDIENSYALAGVWSIWGVNISIDQIMDTGKILCYSAKWLDSKTTMWARYDEPDFLSKLHGLLDEADVVLTYNGKRHDIPWIYKEFLKAGMKPPSPSKDIDLLETVKKKFKFISNKLDWILRELNIGKKVEHEGFNLWTKCLANDPEAWKTMKKYNIADTDLLTKAYKKILPYITNHPNHSLYSESTVCPNCGSSHLQNRGFAYTQVGKYQRHQCQDCGHWSRSRFTEVSKPNRRDIVVPAVR